MNIVLIIGNDLKLKNIVRIMKRNENISQFKGIIIISIENVRSYKF